MSSLSNKSDMLLESDIYTDHLKMCTIIPNVITGIQNELEGEKALVWRAGTGNGISGNKGEMAGNGGKWREMKGSRTKA